MENKDTLESYVDYKIAKLLNEVGFDVKCYYCYDAETGEFLDDNEGYFNFNESDDNSFYSAPALSVVQKWLREVKGLVVQIDFLRNNQWWYIILKGERVDTLSNPRVKHDTYEGALEEGIYECLLKLLKEKKDEESNFM